ncbi:hypothetical protein NHX12_032061 [Muraenolepis orangiensis]|uniref:Uncharacterized protein n=1 Tax=Muraenolepis orangiensis TaxID=630683 RepID=A0A9Q0E726_9TELE|nr:hypothetical protein NHX12_032061 [Muraenolepis orangiensis]
MPPKKVQMDSKEGKPDEDLVKSAERYFYDMFTALLQQQQENFRGFVKMIMDSTNTRLDAITREVQEIRSSILFTQKDADDMKTQNVKQSVHWKSMQADILKNSDGLSAVPDKMEYAEGQSRRSNVVLDGIGEEPGETWEQTEEKVKDILVDKLKLQRGIEIERAHRTGKPAANNTRPRPIGVKFLRFKVRSAVLERDKNLRGTNIYINEDYTDTVRMKRKELLPKLWEVRERGEIAFLRHDKLIIRPPQHSRA